MRIPMLKLIWILALSGLLTAASVNYSYDAAGRLAKIDYGSGGSITYTYDSAGNLLSRTVVAAQTDAAAKSAAAPQKLPAPPQAQKKR